MHTRHARVSKSRARRRAHKQAQPSTLFCVPALIDSAPPSPPPNPHNKLISRRIFFRRFGVSTEPAGFTLSGGGELPTGRSQWLGLKENKDRAGVHTNRTNEHKQSHIQNKSNANNPLSRGESHPKAIDRRQMQDLEQQRASAKRDDCCCCAGPCPPNNRARPAAPMFRVVQDPMAPERRPMGPGWLATVQSAGGLGRAMPSALVGESVGKESGVAAAKGSPLPPSTRRRQRQRDGRAARHLGGDRFDRQIEV